MAGILLTSFVKIKLINQKTAARQRSWFSYFIGMVLLWIVNCTVSSLRRSASYVIRDNYKSHPNNFIMWRFCSIIWNDPPNGRKAVNIFHLESSSKHCRHLPNVTAPTCQSPEREHFCTAVYQGALHWDVATTSSLEMLSWVFVCVLCHFPIRSALW